MALTCEVSRERVKDKDHDKKLKGKTDFFADIVSRYELNTDLKIHFDSDPLAEVMSLHRKGYQPFEIFLFIDDKDSTTGCKITDEDRALAEKVRRHFQNKFMLLQLRQRELSEFQRTVQDMLSRQNYIVGNEIAPLVKLLAFYEEDRQSEKIFANSVTWDDVGAPMELVENTLTFVGSVRRKAKNEDIVRYFWKTNSGHLVKIDVNANTHENQAWKLVAKLPEIKVTGNIFTLHLHGYNIVVGDLKRSKFEIHD